MENVMKGMTVERAREVLRGLMPKYNNYPIEKEAISILLAITENNHRISSDEAWKKLAKPASTAGDYMFYQAGFSDGQRAILAATEPRTVEQVAALLPDTHCVVPVDPTGEQWDGLARTIMLAFDMQCYTPRALLEHLRMSNKKVPQWLLDEPEMASLDHSMSKGTRCVIIYRAMLAAVAVRGEGK